MKTLFAVILSTFAAQASAQALEADLDGNASALQASEMRPQPSKQPTRVARPSSDQQADRQRVAAK